MGYLNKNASKTVSKNSTGEYLLKMNKVYQTLGYISIGIAIVFLLATLFVEEDNFLIIGMITILLFSGLGIPCVLYYQNHEVRFNNEYLNVTSWTGKTNEILWSEIEKVEFNPISGYFKILTLDKMLTIKYQIIGFKTFLQMMERKTAYKASDFKLPGEFFKK